MSAEATALLEIAKAIDNFAAMTFWGLVLVAFMAMLGAMR